MLGQGEDRYRLRIWKAFLLSPETSEGKKHRNTSGPVLALIPESTAMMLVTWVRPLPTQRHVHNWSCLNASPIYRKSPALAPCSLAGPHSAGPDCPWSPQAVGFQLVSFMEVKVKARVWGIQVHNRDWQELCLTQGHDNTHLGIQESRWSRVTS